MVVRKRKTKAPQKEEAVSISEALPAESDDVRAEGEMADQDSVAAESKVSIDDEFLTSLMLKLDMQADQISKLMADNQTLNTKIASLTLRISQLLKEKEQLSIQINDLLRK